MKRLFLLLAAVFAFALPCAAPTAALAQSPAARVVILGKKVTPQGGAGGGGGGGSFTTLDPANTGGTLSGGNLTFTTAASTQGSRSISTLPASGCTHAEVKLNATFAGTLGIATASHATSGGSSWIGSGTNDSIGVNNNSQLMYNVSQNGTVTPSFTFTSGHTIAVEVDQTAKTISFNDNGAGWSTPAPYNSTPNLAGSLYFAVEIDANNASGYTLNFGSSAWVVTPTTRSGNPCVGLT
ncbi:MAG: hypothetical protein JSR98_00675 [Proteobacteria bacterium]|nr:hypothetical protein [Pseudomonadota bacterium]